MRKLVLIAVGAAGLLMAGTKSYSFTLYEPALLGATTLAGGPMVTPAGRVSASGTTW